MNIKKMKPVLASFVLALMLLTTANAQNTNEFLVDTEFRPHKCQKHLSTRCFSLFINKIPAHN